MRILNAIIVLILSVFLLNCQRVEQISYPEYYRGMNQIFGIASAENIDMAICKFDSLSKKIPHVPSSHLFYMAKKCADHNLCELSAKYLEKSLESGMQYGKILSTTKTIDLCSAEITKVLKKEKAIHEQRFNFVYKQKIDSMISADQKARKESCHFAVQNIDSMNMIAILNLMKEYGYPSEKIIGYESAFNAFIILLHMDRDKNNKVFKPYLDKAYSEGFLWPRGYAWIVDRRRSWGDDKLEPYYYHLSSRNKEEFNAWQMEEVNKRRDSIGLGPL